MSWQLRFTRRARENLREISSFISKSSGSEDVAEYFTRQLLERCSRLASLPGTLGTSRTELSACVRSTPHRDYVIFFQYRDNILEIINILHGSRDFRHYFDMDD